MSDLIRIAPGDVTAFDLLNTDSYLVTNFPRQTDMQSSDQWIATQPNPPLLQIFSPSLEVGTGGYYGKFATQFDFYSLTEDMRQYILNTVMSGNPIAKVTVYAEHPDNGFGVYTGELVTPYVANSEGAFNRYDANYYSNNVYPFRRATRKTISYLLMESGDNLLLESGDKIILEQQ